MTEWQRCDFEPLDVIINADSRPLATAYGFEGPLTPVPFSGALRTSILHSRNLVSPTVPDPDGVRNRLGVPTKGHSIQRGGESAYGFAGVWPRSTDGEAMLPSPAFVLRDPTGILRPQLRSDRAPAIWSGSDELDCLISTGESTHGRTETRLLSLSDLCNVLFDAEEATRNRVLLRLSQPPFRSERRFGHRRAAGGAPADGALFSRGSLRLVEKVEYGHAPLPAWVGYTRGIAELLPAEGALMRIAGDGHRAAIRYPQTDLEPVARLGRRVADAIRDDPKRGIMLYLATPAVFTDGWRPPELPGLKLVSAAVPAPFTVSGWDYHRNRPKPQRLAVHAGSVYFYDVEGQDNALATVDRLHFNESICDDAADAFSGFGVCLAGLWRPSGTVTGDNE